MNVETLGVLIATRTLTLKDGEEEQEVLIEIGCPRQFPDGQDYYCPYRITGLGEGKIRYAGGIDRVQALLFTMQRIGAILVTSPEARAGRLTWVGGESGDFGFPPIPTTNDPMSTMRRS